MHGLGLAVGRVISPPTIRKLGEERSPKVPLSDGWNRTVLLKETIHDRVHGGQYLILNGPVHAYGSADNQSPLSGVKRRPEWGHTPQSALCRRGPGRSSHAIQ